MSHFDISKLENELKDLEAETLKEDFWQDIKHSNKILAKIKSIKNKVNEYRKIENEIQNLNELTENEMKQKCIRLRNVNFKEGYKVENKLLDSLNIDFVNENELLDFENKLKENGYDGEELAYKMYQI